MEDLVEEILLRFPPAEPASLVHAALVCKRWGRLVSGRRFRRRFREFHRKPPVLGFLCNGGDEEDNHWARFVPASYCPPHADHPGYHALDSRHGRVLLHRFNSWSDLYVWEPVTEELRKLPEVPLDYLFEWNAAVLCAATGACDHLDCQRGPFLVVYFGIMKWREQLIVCVYSSEAGRWSEHAYVAHTGLGSPRMLPAALVGNALYFLLYGRRSILKYDLATQVVSVIHQLPKVCEYYSTVLITTEDGGLGFASAEGPKLTLWSMEVGPDGDAGWAPTIVVDLKKLIPSVASWSFSPHLVGFVHCVGALFVWRNGQLFSIDLKSDQAREVSDEVLNEIEIDGVVPYMSFYTPVLGAAFTCEEPGVGDSSA